MPNREKVINCLTDIEQIMVCRQEICPREELQYWIELQEGVADAIALLKEQEEEIENLKQTAQSMMEGVCLLKEQEAVKPVLDEQTGRIWLCGKCGSYVGFEDNDAHDPNEFDKYCRDCGTPVLWEGR